MKRKVFDVLDGFFLLLLIVLTLVFFQILQPFLLDIFLAVVFTNIFWGLYSRLRKRLKPYPASAITSIIAFFVIAIPVTIIGILLSIEVVGGYSTIASDWPEISKKLAETQFIKWLESLPYIGQYVQNIESIRLNDLILQAIQSVSGFLIEITRQSFVSISEALIHFVFMIFIMFFLFIDGQQFLARIKDLIPLNNKNTNELFDEVQNMTSATLVSTLIIGIFEGFFGGILFLIFGLPSPVLWGVVMLIVSMIPLVGTNVIIVPAGIVMIASGRYLAGILIIILGLVGITLSQNLLKPKLLGNRSGLHPALVLISTLGAIIWIGVIGFLVGPLMASLFIVVWNQFGFKYREELDARNHKRTEDTETS